MFNIFLLNFLLVFTLVSPVLAGSTTLEFTPQEKQFIKTHPKISVANEMDWPPFDYNEFGKPKGLSIDHIKLIAEKIGIEIDFVNGYTWSELLEQLKNKQIDVLPVMYKNSEREAFTLFSKPYYKGKLGVFSRTSDTNTQTEDLLNKRIGIERKHGAIPIIRNHIKGINLIEIDNNVELVTALATGKVDAIIGNPLLFYFYAREHQIINVELKHYIKMNKKDQLNTSFYIGVRNDWPLLQSVINKTMESLSSDDMHEIESRWIGLASTIKRNNKISLTKDEKEYLKTHPTIKVSNELDYPPFDFAVEGIPQGYSIDLINLLAKNIGIDIEYINGYTWGELVELFKSGKIDMLHTLNKTAERENIGYFSKPVQPHKTHIFTNKNNNTIKSIKQLYGKTVVTAEGWSMQEYLQVNHPQINLLLVNNLEEMLLALSQGRADALINNKLSVQYFIKHNNISNIKEVSWLKEFDNGKFRYNYFLGQKNAPELITMFNKAMLLVDKEDVAKLKQKWFGDIQQDVVLSDEQKAYLAKKEPLMMCVDPNWMPYEEINDKGELTGISSDYVKLFSQRINKEIVLYPTLSWHESLLSIKSRKCDLIPLIVSTEQRKKYLNFSPFYMTFPYVIATKNDQPFIDEFEAIKDKKFAVVKGFSIIDALQQRYKNINIIEVNNAKEGLSKVSDEEVFAYLDASAVIVRTIQKSGIIDIKINGKLPFNSELSVGTHKDEPILAVIFKKAVASLTKIEKKQIYDKWIAVNYEAAFDYILLYKIVSAILFILLISIYWNRKLQKALSSLELMSIELKEKNSELEKLSITDKLTQLYNRVYLDKVLSKEISRFNRYHEPFGVIIIDIDHFKLVNDTYGHHAGDIVLESVANLLTKYSRKNIDTVGRWGGEEFLIICPNTNKEGVIKVAENIRLSIEEYNFENVDILTASFGVSEYMAGDNDITLISRADKALYEAKENGRNRVCI